MNDSHLSSPQKTSPTSLIKLSGKRKYSIISDDLRMKFIKRVYSKELTIKQVSTLLIFTISAFCFYRQRLNLA